MNKNTKIVLGVVLVLAILLVAVGYAAIQTVNLKIESSSAQATPNQSNFTVKFTGTPTTGGSGTTIFGIFMLYWQEDILAYDGFLFTSSYTSS